MQDNERVCVKKDNKRDIPEQHEKIVSKNKENIYIIFAFIFGVVFISVTIVLASNGISASKK